EWRQAIARAGDDADQRQILVALSDVQRERDRGWGKPPLTPFQIETIQSGRIDRLSMNHHLVLDEISANGHGGFYRAWNRNLARIEAIKTISVEPIADESDLQRQLRTRRL